MSIIEEMRFMLQHNFSRVERMRSGDEKLVKMVRFNFPWKIGLYKRNHCLDMTLRLGDFGNSTDEWSINAEIDVKVVGKKRTSTITSKAEITNRKRSINTSFALPHAYTYLHHKDLKVEWHVRIKNMTGIDMPKIEKSNQKIDKSDMTLVVAGQKFGVNKKMLSIHSDYFKTLFDEEDGKSEIKLGGLDPKDFGDFINVVNGNSAIKDESVDGILYLADLYSAKFVVRKCEKFLIEDSKVPLRLRFDTAVKFKLEALRKACIASISTKLELQTLIDNSNPKYMNPLIWRELLKRSLSLA